MNQNLDCNERLLEIKLRNWREIERNFYVSEIIKEISHKLSDVYVTPYGSILLLSWRHNDVMAIRCDVIDVTGMGDSEKILFRFNFQVVKNVLMWFWSIVCGLLAITKIKTALNFPYNLQAIQMLVADFNM